VVETSDDWISQRTGIRQRHLLAPGEGLSTLAARAAQKALESSGVDAASVELVVLATSSPDDLFGDAAHVAREVGATGAVAFDLTAACSGSRAARAREAAALSPDAAAARRRRFPLRRHHRVAVPAHWRV